MKKFAFFLLLFPIFLSFSCAYMPSFVGKPTDRQILEDAKEQYIKYDKELSDNEFLKYAACKYSNSKIDGIVIKGSHAIAYVTIYGTNKSGETKETWMLFYVHSDRGWVFEKWDSK